MLVEGEVALESVVWLTGSTEGEIAQALARAVPGAEWQITVADRARFYLRGAFADVEPRIGGRWAGLVMGRVGSEPTPAAPFAVYPTDVQPTPLHLQSCWFAVDSAGRVACFDRDQLGAAPIERCRGPRSAPAHAPPDTSALVGELAGVHARGTHAAPAFSFVAHGNRLAAALSRGAPPSATRRWMVRVLEDRVVVSGGVGAVAGAIDPALLAWLHEDDVCLGCTRASVLDPRLRGLYVYQHHGLARAAPYDRTAEPDSPWTIDETARTLGLSATALTRSQLPVRFVDKPRLQPMEYVACTWSESVPWESEAGVRTIGSLIDR